MQQFKRNKTKHPLCTDTEIFWNILLDKKAIMEQCTEYAIFQVKM